MGLFGGKETCSICDEKVGMLKIKLKDGIICSNCTKLCSPEMTSWTSKSLNEIKEHLLDRKENKLRLSAFNETDNAGLYLKIDDNNKTWIVPMKKNYVERNVTVFKFDEIIDYEQIEDGETLTKGGLGSAVIGGALLGGVGAVVGGVTGKKKSKTVVNQMYIRISLNNKYVKQVTIKLIEAEVKKNGFTYNLCKDSANKIISLLDYMSNQTQNVINNSNNTSSSADEILKFKNLLDGGIISEDEFNAKKKQLLGL